MGNRGEFGEFINGVFALLARGAHAATSFRVAGKKGAENMAGLPFLVLRLFKGGERAGFLVAGVVNGVHAATALLVGAGSVIPAAVRASISRRDQESSPLIRRENPVWESPIFAAASAWLSFSRSCQSHTKRVITSE